MNCDAIASWYRWIEYAGFGRELERRRCELIEEVANAERVLLLGDGDGRFLRSFLDRNRKAAIDYVELSGRMIELARARTASDRVRFCKGDARSMPLPRAHYDLIVTHFFLDCFNAAEAEALVARIAEAAAPDALWLISEFRQPVRGWQALWARAWLRTLYFFFHVTTGLKTRRLVDHHPLLESQGFRLIRFESSRFGLLASELWTCGIRQ